MKRIRDYVKLNAYISCEVPLRVSGPCNLCGTVLLRLSTSCEACPKLLHYEGVYEAASLVGTETVVRQWGAASGHTDLIGLEVAEMVKPGRSRNHYVQCWQ
jgi:hypothetical protein